MHSYISSFRSWLALWAAGVAVLLLALLAATEAIIRTYVEPKDLFEQSIDVFFNARGDSAFFGDSIVAAGIIPRDDGFVNLATGGEPPAMMQQKIEIFFADKKGGRAVLPANINMLSRQTTSFADYREILAEKHRRIFRSLTPRHRAYSFQYWQTFLFRAFESKRTTLPNGGEVFINAQDNLSFAKWSEEQRLSNAKSRVAGVLEDAAARSKENKRIYGEMIDFLKRKGVQICLASFPMSREFRALAQENPMLTSFWDFFSAEAATRTVRYVDYRSMYDDPAMFIDATHMSESGAKGFTPAVTKKCFG